MRIPIFSINMLLASKSIPGVTRSGYRSKVFKVEALHLVATTFKKVVVVQLLIMSNSLRLHRPVCQAFLFFISKSLLKLMFIDSAMPSNHLILCCLLLLLPSIFPSIRVFSNASVPHIRWPNCWSFNFSISLSDEYSELIFFRTVWFDLLAVQGTLKSILQHHNSKALILWHSAFFKVQLSHAYMTIGKTIALIRWTLGTRSDR